MADFQDFLDAMKQFGEPAKTVIKSFEDIDMAVQSINNSFGESRTRVTEFSSRVADSVRDITRLGGGTADIVEAITSVAESSRRNVVATTESITELYATSKVLGRNVGEITESFAKVGMDYSLIGERMVDNISYIQSLGLNAKEIMGDVLDSMDYMNRFNFQDGVMGLTKMVAQASMLRFDMGQTAMIAERAMDPENAIELASAFQRLGVTMGTLVDPFALMDASINDPGKLQDNIIDLAKTYAQFDERTQRFEINPYGLRMLREVEKQTGLSADNLKKTALAALDLDKRLSEITFSIDASDEDKTLIANLATRDEGGEYIVKVSDEEGYKKLSDLSQGQFDAIVKTQKETPKTMEEIASKQLSFTELITNNTDATAKGLAAALAGQTGIYREQEGLRRVGEDFSQAGFSAMGSSEQMRKMFEGVGNDLRKVVYEAATSQDPKKIEEALKSLETQYNKIPDASANMMRTFLTNMGQTVKPKTAAEQGYLSATNAIKDVLNMPKETVYVKQDVSMNGVVNFKVDTPVGLSRQELEGIFKSKEFQNEMYKAVIERSNVSTMKTEKK